MEILCIGALGAEKQHDSMTKRAHDDTTARKEITNNKSTG